MPVAFSSRFFGSISAWLLLVVFFRAVPLAFVALAAVFLAVVAFFLAATFFVVFALTDSLALLAVFYFVAIGNRLLRYMWFFN